MTLMMSGDKVRAETVQILSLWVNSSILSAGNALKYLRYSFTRAYPPSLMAIIFCLGSVSAALQKEKKVASSRNCKIVSPRVKVNISRNCKKS